MSRSAILHLWILKIFNFNKKIIQTINSFSMFQKTWKSIGKTDRYAIQAFREKKINDRMMKCIKIRSVAFLLKIDKKSKWKCSTDRFKKLNPTQIRNNECFASKVFAPSESLAFWSHFFDMKSFSWLLSTTMNMIARWWLIRILFCRWRSYRFKLKLFHLLIDERRSTFRNGFVHVQRLSNTGLSENSIQRLNRKYFPYRLSPS